MLTLTYGTKYPQNGDKSSVWFPALAANAALNDGHSHQGTDSAQLSNSAILSNAAITRSKLASGTAYRILANSSAGVMSENAALTAAQVVYADANGQLVSEATLATSRGGTNIASYTQGDLLYCSATNVLSKLAISGSNGKFLTSNGTIPSWGAVTPGNLSVKTKTHSDTGYTVLSTDDAISFDTGGGVISVTLPDCASNSGKVYKLRKSTPDFTAVTINAAGSDVILDYVASAPGSTTLNTQGEEIELVSFGSTVWQVVNRRMPSVWTLYTMTIGGSSSAPTKGTTSTDSAYWRRVGDSIQVRYDYVQTGSGSDGSGRYLFPIPSGLTANTTVNPSDSTNDRGYCGNGFVSNNANGQSANTQAVRCMLYNSTNISLVPQTLSTNSLQDSAANVSSSNFKLSGSNTTYSFMYTLPISSWNG